MNLALGSSMVMSLGRLVVRIGGRCPAAEWKGVAKSTWGAKGRLEVALAV